ncbi:hypothetical protein LOD99_844 [Oopsacas minuta]|uniref:Uncharacterized protein n=1 Tax=Oopsacas minuta TaxID=111878 RepID=A0AAV7JZP6_9METZ|nr:hypothetical protein LOD99_844 [Oopsacas minuta]
MHRLQLASIQAAESITVINKMFGTMTSLWKLFYYSPKKAEALKVVQLNCYMQRQTADFSRLPLILKSIIKALEELKEEKADWCSRMLTQVDQLEIDHGIMITMSRSARSFVDVLVLDL